MKLKRIIKWLDPKRIKRMRKIRHHRQEYQRHRECIDRWLARDASLFKKQAQLEKTIKATMDYQMKMIVLNAKLKIAQQALEQIEAGLVISPKFAARNALEQINQINQKDAA